MTQVLKKMQIGSSAATSTKRCTVGALALLFVAGVVLALSLGLPSSEFLGVRGRAYVYPLMGTKVSSSYGNRLHPIAKVVKHHEGLDLAAPHGAPIRAITNGVVIFSDPYAGYGRYVVIKHDGGLTSHYGHCETIKVKPGTRVAAGQIIATVGSTGISTGPHLHFEIRIDGAPQDPNKFIPGLSLPGEG